MSHDTVCLTRYHETHKNGNPSHVSTGTAERVAAEATRVSQQHQASLAALQAQLSQQELLYKTTQVEASQLRERVAELEAEVGPAKHHAQVVEEMLLKKQSALNIFHSVMESQRTARVLGTHESVVTVSSATKAPKGPTTPTPTTSAVKKEKEKEQGLLSFFFGSQENESASDSGAHYRVFVCLAYLVFVVVVYVWVICSSWLVVCMAYLACPKHSQELLLRQLVFL
jgi:hypothetical protein